MCWAAAAGPRLARAPALLAALLAGLSIAGCSGRERTNPLDPANPETHGRPEAFVALAGERSVTLQWAPLSSPALAGYALRRRGPLDSDFVSVGGTLPPDRTSYLDAGLTDDSTYAYRLSFVLASGFTSPPAEAEARPGPAVPWVADAGADLIVRLTPDDRRRVLELPGLDNPADVAVERVRGRVWASSRTLGYVAVWEADGTLVGYDFIFQAPGALAPLPGTNSGWVVEERAGALSLWTPGSGVSAQALGLDLPSDVALESRSGSAWVVDRSARRLLRISPSGVALGAVDLPGRPWRVAADPSSGDVWVSYPEDGAVERRDSTGALLARATGLPGAFTLAPDPARGRVWVTLADANALVALSLSAQVVLRIGDLEAPRGLALDPRTGEVWVTTLGLRDGDGSVWLVSPSGQVLMRQTGFTRPFALALDPG
jgi:streptogramin lyase